MTNVVIPGEGSVVQALFTVQQLWPSMHEAHQMCEHLQRLLKRVHGEMKNRRNVADSLSLQSKYEIRGRCDHVCEFSEALLAQGAAAASVQAPSHAERASPHL